MLPKYFKALLIAIVTNFKKHFFGYTTHVTCKNKNLINFDGFSRLFLYRWFTFYFKIITLISSWIILSVL